MIEKNTFQQHQTLQIDSPLLVPYFLKIWMNFLVSFRFYSKSKFDISWSLYRALMGDSNSFRSFITLYFEKQSYDSIHFAIAHSFDSTLWCTSFLSKTINFPHSTKHVRNVFETYILKHRKVLAESGFTFEKSVENIGMSAW